MSAVQKQQARELTKQGVQAARSGDLKAALPRLKKAVQLDAAYPEGWYWLGRYVGDPEIQMECMERALKLRPDYEQAQEALQRLREQHHPAAQDDEDDFFGADDEIMDFDDPFADLPPPKKVTKADEPSVKDRVSKEADKITKGLSQQFTGENRTALLRAWLAALTYDHTGSYEAMRGRTNPIVTAIMIAVVLALIPVILVLVLIVGSGIGGSFGNILEVIFRTLLGGVVLAIQTVIALYAASYASVRIASTQFGSQTTPQEHFGLTGLYFVPFIVGGGLLFALIMLIYSILNNPSSFALPLSVSLFAAYLFFISHVIFSNIAIHRLNAWRGVIVSGASFVVFGLVWAWLYPLAAPLLSNVLFLF